MYTYNMKTVSMLMMGWGKMQVPGYSDVREYQNLLFYLYNLRHILGLEHTDFYDFFVYKIKTYHTCQAFKEARGYKNFRKN